MAHGLGVQLEGAMERRDTAEKPLLEIDEGETTALLGLTRHQGGVLGQQLREAEFERLGFAEEAWRASSRMTRPTRAHRGEGRSGLRLCLERGRGWC